ncbi:hypothetical protein K437DRAFT_260323 [Tilletiaria anomala UBC 951]|uniref:Mitochondrial import inner membrane translocase subunit n=1 Tax=Tilletiaria anomala (strain ATCC 24038 / CBS 436.72 / UBC 951) TaxID=1037660 RepID=A0A066V2J6_TILAU|nr:uncharacterized protein K437DRAFT_260323 [Tilletiaria anomala UBC 951]KDN35681.1 hypothetical protein K437DRAFT_260323 [Tilletiaria anomala UBC 951]
MDLSSLTGSSGGAKMSAQERKETIKAQVTNELAMANAQQLIEKCYAKCVPSPGGSLSSKEQQCLSRCLERYFEAFNLVSSTYVRRVASERESVPATSA